VVAVTTVPIKRLATRCEVTVRMKLLIVDWVLSEPLCHKELHSSLHEKNGSQDEANLVQSVLPLWF
jgi:hypothetical protein